MKEWLGVRKEALKLSTSWQKGNREKLVSSIDLLQVFSVYDASLELP